jgi:hypothetical protein
MSDMPKLPVEAMCAGCSEFEGRLIRAAFNGRTGALRASKPFRKVAGCDEKAMFEACANYVWRMLCFDYVGHAPHNCMPITGGWDIGAVLFRRRAVGLVPADFSPCEGERDITKTLDALIKQAESVLPVTAQAGAMSWARVFGLVQ